MTVVAMSRQMGSGAAEIANSLCDKMRLRVFDKSLMMRVAHEVGLTEAQIVDYSEDRYELRGFFDALFRRKRTIAEISTRVRSIRGTETVSTQVLDEPRAIDLVRATMYAAYEHDNILIIGRGGQAILEDKPGVLMVRMVAPIEQRIARVRGREQCTAPQARRLVSEHDRATQQYLRTFHHIDVDDPSLYHLMLNTGKLAMDECIELIQRTAEMVSQIRTSVKAA